MYLREIRSQAGKYKATAPRSPLALTFLTLDGWLLLVLEVKTDWFSLSELSINAQVVTFQISALRHDPSWHFPGFAVAAWYLRCVLLPLAPAITVWPKCRWSECGGGGQDRALAGAEVGHMDAQYGAEWRRLFPWWPKCDVLGCPWHVMWLGE